MKQIVILMAAAAMLAGCCRKTESVESTPQPCGEALIAYAEQYPAAEPTDLYKMVFQDLYGPGHIVKDSAQCAWYIERELKEMGDTTALPDYEYTLCDSNFVRVNLMLLRKGVITVEELAGAMVRSAEGMATPDGRFVMSHSTAFKEAYHPHYRIVRRDIFEQELLGKL